MATLPGAWRYRVSTGTGWPGVSILWLGEVKRLICNFYLSVAARKIEQICPWDTLACCWDVKQPVNNFIIESNQKGKFNLCCQQSSLWSNVSFEAEGFVEVKMVITKEGVMQHMEIDFPSDIPIRRLQFELATVVRWSFCSSVKQGFCACASVFALFVYKFICFTLCCLSFLFFFFLVRSPAISLGFTTFGWDFCVCDRFLIQPLR